MKFRVMASALLGLGIATVVAGCAARQDNSAAAEAAALRAEQAAERAEAQAEAAQKAADAATAAADKAVKSVQDATREINAVADRIDELQRQQAARKSHRRKAPAAVPKPGAGDSGASGPTPAPSP